MIRTQAMPRNPAAGCLAVVMCHLIVLNKAHHKHTSHTNEKNATVKRLLNNPPSSASSKSTGRKAYNQKATQTPERMTAGRNKRQAFFQFMIPYIHSVETVHSISESESESRTYSLFDIVVVFSRVHLRCTIVLFDDSRSSSPHFSPV